MGIRVTIGGHKGVSPGVLLLAAPDDVSQSTVLETYNVAFAQGQRTENGTRRCPGAHSDLAEQLMEPTGVVTQ